MSSETSVLAEGATTPTAGRGRKGSRQEGRTVGFNWRKELRLPRWDAIRKE